MIMYMFSFSHDGYWLWVLGFSSWFSVPFFVFYVQMSDLLATIFILIYLFLFCVVNNGVRCLSANIFTFILISLNALFILPNWSIEP